MSSSERKGSKGERRSSILEPMKSLFRPQEKRTLTLSALSSSDGAVQLSKQNRKRKSTSSSGAKGNDSTKVPTTGPSSGIVSNALFSTTRDWGFASQTDIELERHEGLRDAKVEARQTTLAHEITTTSEVTDDVAAEPEIILLDTIRSVKRYQEAIEQIQKKLEVHRETWELSGFNCFSLHDEQDLANLQVQIDTVIQSRMRVSRDQTKWRQSKDVLEQCFKALAPFVKTASSVALRSTCQVHPWQSWKLI